MTQDERNAIAEAEAEDYETYEQLAAVEFVDEPDPMPCTNCGGEGVIGDYEKECITCEGTGWI